MRVLRNITMMAKAPKFEDDVERRSARFASMDDG